MATANWKDTPDSTGYWWLVWFNELTVARVNNLDSPLGIDIIGSDQGFSCKRFSPFHSNAFTEAKWMKIEGVPELPTKTTGSQDE